MASKFGVQVKQNTSKCVDCGCRVRSPGHKEGSHHKSGAKSK